MLTKYYAVWRKSSKYYMKTNVPKKNMVIPYFLDMLVIMLWHFFAVTWIGMGSWACTVVLTFTMVIYIKMIIMQYRSICQSVVVLQYLI